MILSILNDVGAEYDRAISLHKPFNSAHEGLGVIWEEFEELKREVFQQSVNRDKAAMREECVQLAAMACRFIVDVIPLEVRNDG